MDKNFLLAFLLSSLAVFGYYAFFPPEVVNQPEPVATAKLDPVVTPKPKPANWPPPPPAEASILPQLAPPPPAQEKLISIETPLYKADINTNKGVLKNLYLKKFSYAGPEHMKFTRWVKSLFTGDDPQPKHFDLNRLVNMIGEVAPGHEPWRITWSDQKQDLVFSADQDQVKVGSKPQSLTLTARSADGLQVQKTLTFHPDSYVIDMEITLTNTKGETIAIAPKVYLGTGNEMVETESHPQPKEGGWFVAKEGDFESIDSGDLEDPITVPTPPQWAAIYSTYFIQGFKPLGGQPFNLIVAALPGQFRDQDILIPSFSHQETAQTLAAGSSLARGFQFYMGPKEMAEMEKFDTHFPAALDLGWLDFLAHPILALLRWWQSYVDNWGIAIILLTITVRTAMFPLALKGMKSMKRMAHLSPRMKHLREKYKKDKDRLNKEIMALYAKNKINPMGGCLPLLLQVPIFIALYQSLLPAIELRHQRFFFWMDNLSAADHTLILPALMGVTMFIQQHLTPQPNVEPMQAKMMKWMPVVMVFFFLDMPMGLVLYWVASNTFSILQQLIFNKVRIQEVQH